MLLKLEPVQKDIEQWIENFVEVPHPALGGWAPCPYARKARLDRDYEVTLGLAVIHDMVKLSKNGLNGKSVVIVAYNVNDYSHEAFSRDVDMANQQFLLPNNLLALEDHPEDPEIVNGVKMNQGTYALVLVQSLSDLNEKAQLVAKKGFYDSWPEKYLEVLFKHRTDPRQL
jgi:hypothetical protein